MIKHLNIQIYGQVQGVTFRYSTSEMANQLNISGFVRNMPNRSVYIEAEGEEQDLEKFIQWCHDGPAFAKVEKIDIQTGDLKNYTDFSIL